MKRRKFIQATLVGATAPIVGSAGAGGRLYGEPGSLEGRASASMNGRKFALPLSKAGLPAETWAALGSISQVVENVLTSREQASAFFASPAEYLGRHGLSASDKTLRDDSVIFLTVLSHPAVKDALRNGDYAAAFDYLKVAGLFDPREPSVLQQRIESLLRDNITEIRSAMKAGGLARLSPEQEKILLEVLRDSGVNATEDDLAIVAQMVAADDNVVAGCTAVAGCLVAVGIAATVVLYVSVVVAATVILAVGAGVSVAVAVAVTVAGQEQGTQSVQPGGLVSPPFTGTFAKLDPVLLRNTERALRLGAIGGSAGLQRQAVKELIAVEVEAILTALKNTGLLPVGDAQLPGAIRATTAYAHKALGLG